MDSRAPVVVDKKKKKEIKERERKKNVNELDLRCVSVIINAREYALMCVCLYVCIYICTKG